MSKLPHEGVWVRLAPSAIHGIGVFAIRPIPAGTNLFGNDDRPIMWVDAAQVADLPPTLRRLYHDFAIGDGDRLGCPENFNALSVGWYLNQPAPGQPANVAIGPDYAMLTRRDIAEGEELTIRYETFSSQDQDVPT